jgi:5'-nucleotidase / UDP-sugar diphosphatase
MTPRTTFTILHTNDIHSNLIGMAPSSDYTPETLNDDATLGGVARLATLIASTRKAREAQGPVLTLDAGDYSMGTAFGAAIRETGAELQLLSLMGYDATTFGNHDYDLGPDGMAVAIGVAADAGRIPAVVASNTDFSGSDPSLSGLKALARDGVVRRHAVIERGGVRFGLFGLLGKEAVLYTGGAGAITFPDAVETGKEMVRILRETEKVDVVIALSHGGLLRNPDGTYTTGGDVTLAEQVPGIDVVVGGHSHTPLEKAIVVGGRTPVVQAGLYSHFLGELVVTLDGDTLSMDSYTLHPVDDAIAGDPTVTREIEQFKRVATKAVFASRGYRVDEPLVIVTEDVPNTFSDIVASTPLANFVCDADRAATGADIVLTANGMVRSGFTRGKSGVQTVYDVFAASPLGKGVVDQTAGSALVTAYLSGLEIKNVLEYFLVENPAHPGESFPRTSGMRFRYDPSRPKYDVVTAIEVGDLDHGYAPIDISGKDKRLFSVTSPLYMAMLIVAVPANSKGALPLTAKHKDGTPLTSQVEAVEEAPRAATPYLLPPRHTVDKRSVAATTDEGSATTDEGSLREVKEWQAVMDHLRRLPVKSPGELPLFPLDERTREMRAIKAFSPR